MINLVKIIVQKRKLSKNKKNLPKETLYLSNEGACRIWSCRKKYKKLWQAHNKKNTFYLSFMSVGSAATAYLKTNNLNILGYKLVSSIQDKRNVVDKEN